jgi:hypothetical protein
MLSKLDLAHHVDAARAALPDTVDLTKHADLLKRFGLDPAKVEGLLGTGDRLLGGAAGLLEKIPGADKIL